MLSTPSLPSAAIPDGGAGRANRTTSLSHAAPLGRQGFLPPVIPELSGEERQTLVGCRHGARTFPEQAAFRWMTSQNLRPQASLRRHRLAGLTRASLGRALAMVLQEPFLFSGTVLKNIGYASGAGEARIIAGRRRSVRMTS